MNGCDVCLIGEYDLENDFYAEKILTARREHRCCECQGRIEPGQPYERETGKSDGAVWTYKTCALCAEVRRVFYCGRGGWIFGGLWEEMADQAFPRLTTASPCFTELSPAARAFVLDRWRAWKLPHRAADASVGPTGEGT